MPEETLVLQCVECGYEGPFAEFVKDDPDDTTCPQCGADEQVFLM